MNGQWMAKGLSSPVTPITHHTAIYSIGVYRQGSPKQWRIQNFGKRGGRMGGWSSEVFAKLFKILCKNNAFCAEFLLVLR